MTRTLIAGIETGGTKIIARIVEADTGDVVAEGKWPTADADRAVSDLSQFLTPRHASGLAAIGMAAFGPLVVDSSSPDYGMVLPTPKPGWTGANIRSALQERLGIPVAVDTDVNAAAIAEQRMGAGVGVPSVAYVTVGTGIGAGLAADGRTLKGAMHPEAGHLRLVRLGGDDLPSGCPYHDDCAEGLVAGPAIRGRLGERSDLSEAPELVELVEHYLGQLAAALVLAWSPHRIIWGGGVIQAAPMLDRIETEMRVALGGYGVGPAAGETGFCVPATLEHAGLEGAILMAKELALGRP
jgi:fructokinase